MTDATCSVEGCEDAVVARHWCKHHYMKQWRAQRAAGVPKLERRRTGVPCDVVRCERLAIGDGLCRMHYERRRKGKPIGDAKPLRRASGEGAIMPSGYKVLSIDGRAVLEHRHVMERHLGRSLVPGESVHHRNGRRSDNDISNLELWVKPQPSGQRPEDLAEWVVEHYPELVEAALSGRRQLRLAT